MGVQPIAASDEHRATRRAHPGGAAVLRTLSILAAGIGATLLTMIGVVGVYEFLRYEDQREAGYLLGGAALAGPLFGTIAGSRTRRWSPLVTGSALAFAAFAAMMIVLTIAAGQLPTPVTPS